MKTIKILTEVSEYLSNRYSIALEDFYVVSYSHFRVSLQGTFNSVISKKLHDSDVPITIDDNGYCCATIKLDLIDSSYVNIEIILTS